MSIRLEARNRGNIRLDMDNASLAAKYAREAETSEKAAGLSAANAAGAAERANSAAETALRAAAGAQSAAVHLPQPGENGTWLIWDQTGGIYVDSGANCVGVQGERGLKGDPGDKGDDGVSPGVSVFAIAGGHRVTITDAEHPQGQSFDVPGGSVTVDTTLSLAGENPVQNKAIYAGILKAFPTATASGPVASFPDGADNLPVKKLEVQIVPVQAGSGDPSPENVRPISGWTEIDVTVSPTQIAADGSTTHYLFPTPPGTVYGGTLTINGDGSGTLEDALEHINLGSLTWTYESNNQRFKAGLSILSPEGSGRIIYCLCDCYATKWNGEPYDPNWDYVAYITSNAEVSTVWVHDHRFNNSNDLKSALANKFIVYPKRQKTTYTLTAQQVIETLKGLNNIWADCGDVSVEYRADPTLYINGKLTELVSMITNIETGMTASKAYAVNDFLTVNNQLYIVTAPIANGGTITPGTNVTETTIGAQITGIVNT